MSLIHYSKLDAAVQYENSTNRVIDVTEREMQA